MTMKGLRMRLILVTVALCFPISLSAQSKHRRVVQRVPPVPPACQMVSAINGSSLEGKAIESPEPIYPPTAKAKNISGAVDVEVVVDEKGFVTSARALHGPTLLQQPAIEAARRMRFPITSISGRPVKVKGTILYKFEL
jgi:TonB family protein